MFNQPHISWSSIDVLFSDKEEFRTLVRTTGPMNFVGMAIMELMDTFHWERVGVLSFDNGK